MRTGILSAVGNTPLVRLERFCAHSGFELFAKLESLNPGGSSKDRPALAVLDEGLSSGAIRPDTVIVESSSGNMGIGLAQACCRYGLRFICVVDPKASSFNLKILELYGAEVDMVLAPDPISGEFLQARLERVQLLQRQIPNSFWPNQYANLENSGATTGRRWRRSRRRSTASSTSCSWPPAPAGRSAAARNTPAITAWERGSSPWMRWAA